MHKTKIDWADYSWNPVWGCRNSCPYCYARALAHRLNKSFEPHWMEKNFASAMPKEPSVVFVNSMSEVEHWRDDWLAQVLVRILENPEHAFLFLTKNPQAYERFDALAPENVWFGATTTTAADVHQLPDSFLNTQRSFLSIEPLHGDLALFLPGDLDWVIVGAETGNRSGRIRPEEEWIDELVEVCADNGIPLFMKDNLKPYWRGPMVRQVPEGLPLRKNQGEQLA